MTGGVPSPQTIERIFSLINPKELENILNEFLLNYIKSNPLEKEIINFDGRVDRGSSRNKTEYSEKVKPLN